MRKVVLYTLMSLDGAVDAPGRYFPETEAPGAPVFDSVMAGLESDMIATQDAVLLGRNMYDEWSRYWPTSEEQPFADFINGVTKYVVTSSPLANDWANAKAVGGTVTEVVRDLKSRPGGDIGVHGSIQLAQALLAEGLVNELHLAVGRVVDPRRPTAVREHRRDPCVGAGTGHAHAERQPLAHLPHDLSRPCTRACPPTVCVRHAAPTPTKQPVP